MASIFHHPLTGQYLFKVYSEPYLINRSVNTADNPCFDDNSTSPSNVTDPETLVQQMVAQTEMYLSITHTSLELVAVIVMAVLASVTSRRLLLIVPLIGYVGRCVVIYMVVSLDFGINWLYLSYVLESVVGGHMGFSFASYLYLSEITSATGMRSFSIAILECFGGIVTAALNIVTGQLLEHQGYTLPSMLSVVSSLLAVLIAFYLPHNTPNFEQAAGKRQSKLKGLYHKFKEPFRNSHKVGLKTLIYLACLSYIIGQVGEVFTSGSTTLYLQRFPFCWSSGHFGWYEAVSSFSTYVFVMFSMSLITQYSSGGVAMGIPGMLCASATKIIWAVASSDIYIYIGLVVGLPANFASILVRGETSRILEPKAQSPWFAVVIIIEILCSNLSSPALALYRFSLGINFPGLNFYVCAFFYAIKALVLLGFQLKWRQYMVREKRRDASTSTDEDCFIERSDAATNTEVHD